MKPKVSIIVPVYNVEEYLAKCLKSICLQTLKEIEIIVVNDGTKDNSQLIIDDFIKKDKRIKCIKKENGGLSSARNAGLKISNGDYIGFVDSDDWIEPRMFEELYNNMEKYKVDLVACGYKLIFPDRERIEEGINDEVFSLKEIGLENFLLNKQASISVVAWNKLYRKEIIVENNLKFEPNNEIFSEDILFTLSYSLFCEKICCIKQPLYNYLIRKGSIMNSPKFETPKKLVKLVSKFNHLVTKSGKENEVGIFTKVIMLDMATRSLYSVRASTNSLRKVLKELDINPIYREYLWKLLKSNIDDKYKIKAILCLLKPYWLSAITIRMLFSVKYKN